MRVGTFKQRPTRNKKRKYIAGIFLVLENFYLTIGAFVTVKSM